MTKENDVATEDVYKELEKALKSEEAGEEESPVASDQEPKADDKAKEVVEDENAELSEEEISKLSPRAQKRIREQAEEIKRLAGEAAKPKEEAPETPKDSPKFKNVDEFLAAVQDEPSRNLLKQFAEVIKSETSEVLAPIEQKNNEAKFDATFSQYEKIEGLSDHKESLKKTFLRNPNQSLKALIGETVADLQLSKVKPIEKTPSTPNRGKVNLDNLSKDELYDQLESMRE